MILNGWKEIARYLGCSVRTVQRYEQELHLPVRRPRSKYNSAVFSLSAELDRWTAQRPPMAAFCELPTLELLEWADKTIKAFRDIVDKVADSSRRFDESRTNVCEKRDLIANRK